MTLIHNKIKELDFSDACRAELLNYFDGKQRSNGAPYEGSTPHENVAKLNGETSHVINDVYAIMYRHRSPNQFRPAQELVNYLVKRSSWRTMTATEKKEAKQVQETPVAKVEPQTKKELRALLLEKGVKTSNRSSMDSLTSLAKEHGVLRD